MRKWTLSLVVMSTANYVIAGDDLPPPYPSVTPVSFPVQATPIPTTPELPTAQATPPAVPVLPKLPDVTPVTPVLSTLPVVTPTVPPVTPPTVVTPVVKTEPAKPSSVSIKIGSTPGVLDQVGKLSSAINDSKLAYGKLMDYSCHWIVQERVNSKLSGNTIYELHARTKPASVYVKLVEPKAVAGVEYAYVAGKYSVEQVRVKQAGGTFESYPLSDSRSMIGKQAANIVGMGAILDRIHKQIETETRLANPVGVTMQDYVYAGKSVTRYEITCERSHAYRAHYRTVVYIDTETRLPIRFETYDEPRGGTSELLECQSFVNLKTNVGHSAAVFDR